VAEPSRGRTPEHFIPRELRQPQEPERVSPSELEPGAPTEEIRRRAAEALGEEEHSRLGLGETMLPPEIWQTVFTPSADVTATALDKETVILNLETGRYYTLNRVGSAIWEQMTGDRSLAAILAGICQRFDVTEEVARQGLVALVSRLRQENLIVERR
jgi:coenzyme PQQ synthesis protein D (PqqD)